MTNQEKNCTDCKHYYTDYDCREFCENRDMFEPNKKIRAINEEEKLDLIGCGINIGGRWSKQNTIAELKKVKEEIENIDLLQDRAYEQSWSEKHSKSPLDIKKEALSILDNHIKEENNDDNA